MTCPNCESEDIESTGPMEDIGERNISIPMKCNTCKTEFYELYEFVGVEIKLR
jgi:hypothetical protein